MHHTPHNSNLSYMRHSCAHLLAAAVVKLWPDALPTIGPPIENGFYYDFDNIKISNNDLPKIEEEMRKLVKDWNSFTRIEVDTKSAKEQFKNNPYKQELIDELARQGEHISLYTSGSFTDLCRGGHCEHPNREIKYFKLQSIAGAYWRGSEKNKMLTRIYGTCFPTKAQLDAYLIHVEESKKRDHRKIGKEQKLFFISPSVGSGFPIYQPRGFILYRQLTNWIMREKEKRGYQFVWTPHIAKSDLYKQSGHWQKYDAMMQPMKIDEEEYVVKPMNCPHHFQIYNEHARSYRELPLRIAEIATVYRFEKAGEVNGLLRVRALTQDDSHIFVRHNDIADEIDRILDLALFVFERFRFKKYSARVSIRDPKDPSKYLGDPKSWERAEKALIDAVKRRKMEFYVGEGEAAFYGPKIDIVVKDAIGRDWQLTTCQLDFVQPENFNLRYVNENGLEEAPAVLHVAILGSVDRFLGILIEHYAGVFPLWLAPVQVAVIPIAQRHNEFAQKAVESLLKAGIRAIADIDNEPMQAKIRNHTLQKVPYMAIIGDRESKNGSVSVRTRAGEDLKDMSTREFLARLTKEIETNA